MAPPLQHLGGRPSSANEGASRTTEEVRFCRIHHVLEGGTVFVEEAPAGGSPSERFYKNPQVAQRPVEAVFMGQMLFERPDRVVRFQGTLFFAAPDCAITAGHRVDEYADGAWNGRLANIRGRGGSFVPSVAFNRGGIGRSCDCSLVASKNAMGRVRGGLPTRGADVAVVHVTGPRNSFILPCSPQVDMPVSVFSYPDVSAFMRDAESELVHGKPPLPDAPSIWHLYREALGAHGRSTKQELYSLLEDAFQGFMTGEKVASPGTIQVLSSHAVGACYTALAGSSGAPICSVEFPDFYCGIHVAGSEGANDMNIGTSCDNPEFVEMFKLEVLDRLPGPEDMAWSSFVTLDPFFQWLNKHGIQWVQPRLAKRTRTDHYSPTSPVTPSTFPAGLQQEEILSTPVEHQTT